MRECGGVKYVADTELGGDKGSDAVKFEKIGDYQYLVYVSMYKHRASPKGQGTNQTKSPQEPAFTES